MTRKFLAIGAALALVFSFAGSAMAGVLVAPDSTTIVQLGGGQGITITGTYQQGGNATLSNNGGGHDLTFGDDIWTVPPLNTSPTGTTAPYTGGQATGTSLYTGVALLTDLIVDGHRNNAGALTVSYTAVNNVGGNLTNPTLSTLYSGTICPAGCLGGPASVDGSTVLQALGLFIPIENIVIGVTSPKTNILPLPGGNVIVTGGPWVTGKVRLTGLKTNVISLPNRVPTASQQVGPQGGPLGVGVTLRPGSQEQVSTLTISGGFRKLTNPAATVSTRQTVTLSGANNLLSASGAGSVTLISPLRIDTGPLGLETIPGFVEMKFVFAPEPGTLLLLASGAAGLVLIGRRRSKK